MRRAWWVLGLFVAAVVPASGVGAATEPGGRVTLQPPFRITDTRSCAAPAADGCPRVTSWSGGPGVFTVWILDWTAPGTATIRRCADPNSIVAAFDLEVDASGQGRAEALTLTTGEQLCLTSTTPVHLLHDYRGEVADVPTEGGSQYVALDSAIDLFGGPTVIDPAESPAVIARPSALRADASAAVLSIEVLDAAGPGYIAVYACENPQPMVSDVAFRPATASAAVALVAVGPTSELCIKSGGSPAAVRIDLLGELRRDGPDPTALPPSWRSVPGEVAPPSLQPVTPSRVLDTRFGIGRPGIAKVAADEVVELDLGLRVGSDTQAAVLNVTVTEPESAGFLTVWPCGTDRPTVSNLNFVAGETVPNLVVARLGTAGRVCLSGIARTHLIADLAGTVEGDGGYHAVPIDPVRILDTREPHLGPGSAMPADSVLELAVAGHDGVPLTAAAVTLNVTVTEPAEAGFITVFPCGDSVPTASNVNYTADQTVPNSATVALSPEGTVCFYTRADTHLVADLAAWYGVGEDNGLITIDPVRTLDTRSGLGAVAPGAVGAGQFTRLQLGGTHGIPADATAVVMNLTATQPDDPGYVTAWPCDRARPVVSNLNYSRGETVPNLATVKLAADGSVCLFTRAAAHLVADVSGYLTDAPVGGYRLELLSAEQ